MYVDLHVHSHFSDGTRSPEELASFAREASLGLIAVCDHDTVEGYQQLVLTHPVNGGPIRP